MIPAPLRTLLEGPEFRTGLLFGLGGLLVGLALGTTWRAIGRAQPIACAGLLLAAAGALALRADVEPAPGRLLADPSLPGALALGLAALAGAGLVVDLSGWPRSIGALLAVPGAWLVAARADPVDTGWLRLAVAGVIVLGGWAVASFDRRWRDPPLAPALLALSAVGIYFTVPDTEEAMVLLGVAAPLAVLGWPLRVAALGVGGSMAATGLLCWTVAAGGYGRRSSIVGGLACLGLLAAEPAARLAGTRPKPSRAAGPGRPGVASVLSAHLVLVYVASRVAGLRLTVPAAVGVVAVEAVVAVGALAMATRRRRAAG